MLKNILIGTFAAIIVVAIGASAYTAFASPTTVSTAAAAAGNGAGGNGHGNGGQVGTTTTTTTTGTAAYGNGNGTGTTILDIPASELSDEEVAALTFMREEEKLARDVYTKLYEIWGQPTFQNIASSEQKHMDEIAILLDRYGLADLAQAPGVFTDPAVQSLYNDLVAQGSQSIGDALKVGAAIEEIDILDLQERLAQTDNADIQQVFTSLMSGSYSHLRAFTGVLQTQTGEVYVPQYMTVEQYDAAIAGYAGNGAQGSNGYHGGQNTDFTGSAGGTGVAEPQVLVQDNLVNTSTFHGVVSAYEWGTLTVQVDDGQLVAVQLGNVSYVQSLGFAPQVGEGLTISGFPGDQGLFSATSITTDSGLIFNFRETTGRPVWAGGNGKGGGNH